MTDGWQGGANSGPLGTKLRSAIDRGKEMAFDGRGVRLFCGDPCAWSRRVAEK